MARSTQINITESIEDLKILLNWQVTVSHFQRVQVLYLLKAGKFKTIQEIADVVGKDRTTIQRWLAQYRTGGLKALLAEPERTGRPKIIPDYAIERLVEKLKDPQGFPSYKAIQLWLKKELGIDVNYDVVHNLVHDKLQANLKVPRPKSNRQGPGAVEQFKKTLPEQLKAVVEEVKDTAKKFRSIRFWCEDESRFGLKTIERLVITLRGVKPIGERQWKFEAYYLYGMVEPKTGEGFFCEIPHVDTDCFQVFLDWFAETYSKDFHIIQVDQAAFHMTSKLKIPDNIVLFPQPPACPEVNPIERVWEYIKSFLGWKLFSNLDALKEKVAKVLTSLTLETIASLTGWQYILDALIEVGL